MNKMTWLLLATGFTGALTLRFLLGLVAGLFTGRPPRVNVHFSPHGGCTEAVVARLQQARHEILVLAYSFTSRPITDALIHAKKRGVRLNIILDHSNEKEPYTDLPHLLENGIHPLIDAKHAIAHNKVMIIDNRTVITGSFNFTHQAEGNNAENLLILDDHPELVQHYRKDFENHRSHSQSATVPKQVPRQPASQGLFRNNRAA
jgi:phosphatidylserine/phosphatidylglycerophosphate/cardiolipin synthase-like enzyme